MSLATLRNRDLRGGTVAAVLVGVCLWGCGILHFASWGVIAAACLLLGALPFVRRALSEAPAAAGASHSRSGMSSRSRWLWALAVLVAGTEIMVSRNPDAFLNPQFWQEDAFLFQDAREDGIRSILDTLHRASIRKGQSVLSQRLIAYMGRRIRPREVPRFYVLASLAVTLAVAVYVLYARIDGLGIVPRVLMALSILIVYNTEHVYLTLINLQWILALLLLLLLMEKDPETRLGRGLLFGGFTLLCLTGPFITFLWVLAFLRAVFRPTPCSRALLMISLACTAWQFAQIQILIVPGKIALSDPAWPDLVGRAYVGQLFFGWLVEDLTLPRLAYAALFVAIYTALSIWAWRRRDLNVAGLLLASLLFLGSAAISYRTIPWAAARPGHRYYFVPCVCLTWAMVYVAAQSRRGIGRLAGGVALACIVSASLSQFTERPLPDMNWPECSRAIERGDRCLIYTNPYPKFSTYYEDDSLPKAQRAHIFPDPLPPSWQ